MSQICFPSFQATAASRWSCSSLASCLEAQLCSCCITKSLCWTSSWVWRQRRGSAWALLCSAASWLCCCPRWDFSSAACSWVGCCPSPCWWLLDTFRCWAPCGCQSALYWLPASSLPSSRFSGRSSSASPTHPCLEQPQWCCAQITSWGRSCFQIRCMICFVKLPHARSAGSTGPSLGYFLFWASWVCWCSVVLLQKVYHTEKVRIIQSVRRAQTLHVWLYCTYSWCSVFGCFSENKKHRKYSKMYRHRESVRKPQPYRRRRPPPLKRYTGDVLAPVSVWDQNTHPLIVYRTEVIICPRGVPDASAPGGSSFW